MQRSYHILDRNHSRTRKELAAHLARQGQLLLPLLELVEQSRQAIDELIDVVGRATIEAVLEWSAEQVAGARSQGQRRSGAIGWHGRQQGRVYLKERKLAVERPRLRRRGRGSRKEVTIPAYEALREGGATGARMLEILLRGVSTRDYQRVLPAMADTVGVSHSSVSREARQAAEAELERLLDRRFDAVNLLVIYLDGMQFGDTHVIAAVGVDEKGHKHVLGIQEGATENAAAVKDLLERLVAHGVKPQPKLLFVIDGSKALRAAIRAVFGPEHPVQRCRTHKLRNVLERLPEEQKDQVRAAMRAAWRLDAKAGMGQLEKLAQWLERDYPAAAASLREGLEECFTLNRLGVPPSLHRCLATTNLIESPQAGVRMRTRRVCRWRDAAMVQRWVAAAFLATEQNFRRLMGYQDLWMLEAILRGSKSVPQREVA